MDKKYYKNNYYKHFFKKNYALNYAFRYQFFMNGITELPFTVVVASIRKLELSQQKATFPKYSVLSPKKMCSHIKHWQQSRLKRVLKDETNSSRRMYNRKLSIMVSPFEEDEFDRAYYGKNHEFGDKWKYW